MSLFLSVVIPAHNEEGSISETLLKLSKTLRAEKIQHELIVVNDNSSDHALFGLNAVIFRCGVICGPGQFGKTDQGVFTYWLVAHALGRSLRYSGFGGKGFQVRDLLHPEDLSNAIQLAYEKVASKKLKTGKGFSAPLFNLGGGLKISTSLFEWTQEAQRVFEKTVPITSDTETHPVDIPWYVTDYSLAEKELGWVPKVSLKEISEQIGAWIKQNLKEIQIWF